jgi:hypothetical protein
MQVLGSWDKVLVRGQDLQLSPFRHTHALLDDLDEYGSFLWRKRGIPSFEPSGRGHTFGNTSHDVSYRSSGEAAQEGTTRRSEN